MWPEVNVAYNRCRSLCTEASKSLKNMNILQNIEEKQSGFVFDNENFELNNDAILCGSLTENEAKMLRESKDQLRFIKPVCSFLDRSISSNDIMYKFEPIMPTNLEAFASSAASFKGSYYVKRILKYSGASPCCAITGLIYLDRLQQNCVCLPLTSKTLQRLLLVALMTAAKYMDDVCCKNSRW